MKKIVLVAATLIISTVLTACSTEMPKGEFKVPDYPTLESMVTTSQLVAEVKVSDQVKETQYSGTDFATTKATIKDAIVGDKFMDKKEIQILEVIPEVVNKNERYILFMEPYEGPVVENQGTYVVKGVYQGKLHIDANDKLDYEGKRYSKETSFHDELVKESLATVKEKIKQSKNKTK